ncbi:unnamed protein product, partial [Protopolystoma xenopodis]
EEQEEKEEEEEEEEEEQEARESTPAEGANSSCCHFYFRERPCLCCETELWAIGMSLMLQDMPFLALRLTMIIRFNVLSYSNMFFTCKNTLVIMLQVFRSGVIIAESWHKKKSRNRANKKSLV